MNDTQTLSERADALEDKMSRDLDYIVIKSRLYSMAEADMGPAPNAGALMATNPNAPTLSPAASPRKFNLFIGSIRKCYGGWFPSGR